jgi:hypothetical protein
VTTNDNEAPRSPLDPLEDVMPVANARVQPRSRSSRAVNLALGGALAIAVAGVAFAVGRGTASTSVAGGPDGQAPFGGPGASFQPGGGQAFRGGLGGESRLSIRGTVTGVDAASVTITTSSGTTITLSTNGDTGYHQRSAATAADVATGKTVVVEVDGFGGPGGGAGPGSSAAPSGGTATAPTATDITVVP